jgi:hypothetical protein
MDGDGGEHHGESRAGTTEVGRDKTGPVAPEKAEKTKNKKICLANYDTLH